MKKIVSISLVLAFMLFMLPANAAGTFAQTARTTPLDLSNQTTSASSSAEGWSFNPHGDGGNALLTLNSYGNMSQHSAPIIVPKNTKIIVNGTCYIDNIYMGEPHPVITMAAPDGYVKFDGTGTLNLYAQEYNGRCIDVYGGGGGSNDVHELLYIDNITVNCYSKERDMYSANTLEACIYSNSSIYITNAVIRTYYGGCGIRAYGYTPIGGVTEQTASEIVIDNSTVNIQNESANGLWQYAQGIRTTFGKIRITGNSNVTINAGSLSIYSYLSCTIEGGNVRILSTPVSTADAAAIVYVGALVLKSTLSSVYFSTTRYPMTKIVHTTGRSTSYCDRGVQFQLGSFNNVEFLTDPDPNNNDLPAIKAVGSGASWLIGDVDDNGVVNVNDALLVLRFSMGLISTLPKPQAADVDGNGAINMNDALKILRASMGLVQL